MFRYYRVILRELVINALPSYTSISNAAVGNTVPAMSPGGKADDMQGLRPYYLHAPSVEILDASTSGALRACPGL
jgi:hypothetical protein